MKEESAELAAAESDEKLSAEQAAKNTLQTGEGTENKVQAFMTLMLADNGLVDEYCWWMKETLSARTLPWLFGEIKEQNKSNKPNVQTVLAMCYQHGLGVDKDPEKAVTLYKLAVKQDHAAAQNALAKCYRNAIGVNRDTDEAVRLYGLAIEQGHIGAQAALAEYYCNHKQELPTAIKLLEKAVKQGHAAAQNALAKCYKNAIGVNKDLGEAVRLYGLAAEQGHAAAQNALAVCYTDAIGVNKNLDEATRLYKLAAKQGHEIAQCNLDNLATCYTEGVGVEHSTGEAGRLYGLAAEQGHAAAERCLDARDQDSECTGMARYLLMKNPFIEPRQTITSYKQHVRCSDINRSKWRASSNTEAAADYSLVTPNAQKTTKAPQGAAY